MTDSMLPILRQMNDAPDDRARGAILLRVPDAVLMKYRDAFEGACRRARFDVGLTFIEWRRAAWCAVRQADGSVKPEFEAVRAEFAAWVKGEAG